MIAITRRPPDSLSLCELTFVDRIPIDIGLAKTQHASYCETLSSLGVKVIQLPEIEELPDSVFVEDTAVVLPEVAIVTNPGAESRRPEARLMADVLSEYRELHSIDLPGTIDGGDVLTIGKTCFVGLSSRTNRTGFEAFRKIVLGFGYRVQAIENKHSLHLKTGVTALNDETIIVNVDWLDVIDFKGFRILETKERFGANVLRLHENVVVHKGFEKTNEMLVDHGFELKSVNISEFLKAEAGLTCLSLIVSGSAHLQ